MDRNSTHTLQEPTVVAAFLSSTKLTETNTEITRKPLLSFFLSEFGSLPETKFGTPHQNCAPPFHKHVFGSSHKPWQLALACLNSNTPRIYYIYYFATPLTFTFSMNVHIYITPLIPRLHPTTATHTHSFSFLLLHSPRDTSSFFHIFSSQGLPSFSFKTLSFRFVYFISIYLLVQYFIY